MHRQDAEGVDGRGDRASSAHRLRREGEGRAPSGGLHATLRQPTALLVTIPMLVAVLGLTLVLGAVVALRQSARAVARERLHDACAQTTSVIEDAFRPAEALVARVVELAREHSPEAPLPSVARTLVDLAAHRAGVAYVSLSFPDGTFQGAYRDADGTWRFQDSRVMADGTHVRRFDVIGSELRPYRDEITSYDPRARGFYRDALSGARWTAPYTFFGSHRTGITRVEAVRVADHLHAVVTVDFDVDALSAHLREHRIEGGHALLFTDDGTVLAHDADDTASERAAAEDRTLRVADLHIPVLTALVERGATTVDGLGELDVDGEIHLTAERRLDAGLGLPWRVAAVAPRAHFMETERGYALRGVASGLVALLVAAGIAFLFARHSLRARAEVASARAEAAAARARAEQLGSYRLVDLLGKGAMGEVWRAEHTLLSRQAAVKLIAPTKTGEPAGEEARERFRREAEALSRLRSRHTVELYDFGISDDGRFFLVTELLDGLDLETLVTRHGPLPMGRVVSIVRQVCRSLGEAHGAGLVHRDVKPANLFVTCEADELDVVKVLDFGVVRLTSRDASSSVPPRAQSGEGPIETLGTGITGTPAFMAPEQAQGLAVDGRADLYALACVAVWLATGKLVYDRPDAMAHLLAQISSPVPDLDARLAPLGAPEPLIDLLMDCLAKEPDARPKGASDVLARLSGLDVAALGWTEDDARSWWKTRRSVPAAADGAAEIPAKATQKAARARV